MDIKAVRGAPNVSARAMCLLKALEEKKGDLLLVVKEEEAFADYANAFSSLKGILAQPPVFEPLFWGSDAALRAQALKFLYSQKGGARPALILLATPGGLAEKIMGRAAYGGLTFEFSPGGVYPRAELSARFQKAGYARVPFVENRGEYAVRGSVVDYFPPDREKPIRLFFSDTLESIRSFEIDTQATSGFMERAAVTPNSFSGFETALFELAGPGWRAFLDQGLELPAGSEVSADEIFSFAVLSDGASGLNFGAVPNANFNSDLALVEKEIRRLKKERYAVSLFCINRGEADRLRDLFEEKNLAELVNFRTGYIQEGFLYAPGRIAVLTSSEIFQRRYRIDLKGARPKGKAFKWADLKTGDFVVHEDYGVGRYLGIKKAYYRNANNENVEDADCLLMEYARGDKLMVPLHEFNRVQKFISSEGKVPKLSHMDTKTWHELKSRVRAEVQALANDILKVEAERMAIKTIALPEAGRLETEFAGSFPFEETPDQLAAIRDVLTDLESTVPMNRLVVGDVGFGKTEVAMRAAMRAVFNGRQAVVLAPTTILADQHFNNFLNRFREFPVKIGVISRFETRSDQKKILEDLARGKLDIVIGTHRLLQKDVKLRNLGLLIIDEEHRFGVKDKEKLKAMAKGVHLLMLSATPIPRTLYQSLSTLKTMSVIESPPVGRLPIATQVRPFDETALVNAVNFELARGGQVYYVHNRVQTIDSRRAYLEKIMPYLRVAVVHGQMKGEQIEKYMWDFLHKKYDVLIASTIIESGLDIPSVNTMIVENAHELGLAQLYQLRGRIGREKQKAYCYLFYPGWMRPKAKGAKAEGVSGAMRAEFGAPPDDEAGRDEKTISELAMKRLSALEEFTELGSGFRLAMRDMELRGAGELLGVRQHGFINSIGLEMYIKLLNGEINRIKGRGEIVELPEVKIDLELPAFIPEDYIGDDMERLNFYKKLLNADLAKVDKIMEELADLSGPAPQPLRNLAAVIKLKKELARLSVRSVTQKGDTLEIFFQPKAPIGMPAIKKWQELFGADIIFLPSRFGDGLRITGGGDPLGNLRKVICVF
ncbi:MAG: DEAD/DEAH box helicase [Elusimicrobiales bacterium]|jgi:transcription-repair coupling factor (superfamily II helicase)